jgi:hypothetical protein
MAYIPQILIRKKQTLATTVCHYPTATRANPSLGEARGGHEEGVELLLEARRAPEPPLTIVYARRRGAATASHLGFIPRHVSSRVRTPSTPTSFCPKNPTSPCLGDLGSEALASPTPPPPLALPCWTNAPPPSAGFDESCPLIDGRLGLDCQYLFVLTKIQATYKRIDGQE